MSSNSELRTQGRVVALADLIGSVETSLHSLVTTRRIKLDWKNIVVLCNEAMKLAKQLRSLSGSEKHAVVMGALKLLLRHDGVLSDGDKEILDMADDILPALINGLYEIAPRAYKSARRRGRRCLAGCVQASP